MKVFLKICKALLYILYFLIIAAGIAIAVLLLQGKRLFCIETGSMEPNYTVGAMVVVERAEFEQLSEGDVITYVISDSTVVTHRLVGIDPVNRQLTTKGDANAIADGAPVSYENVIGRVSFCIPVAGWIFIILSTRFGRIMLCILVLAIIGIYLIRRYARSPADDDPLPEGEAENKDDSSSEEAAASEEGAAQSETDAPDDRADPENDNKDLV